MRFVDHLRGELVDVYRPTARAFRIGFLGGAAIFALWLIYVTTTAAMKGPQGLAGTPLVSFIIFTILWTLGLGVITGFVFAVTRALFHLAGPWFIPPLVIAPVCGAGLAYLCSGLSVDGAAAVTMPVFEHLGAMDRTGVIAAPIIAIVLAGSLVFFYALFFLLGVFVGLVITLPPLLWGIGKRIKARADARNKALQNATRTGSTEESRPSLPN